MKLGENIWKMNFHKTWKELKKGEGGCGSAVCIGLECLCKVIDFKRKALYNFCVSFVNFGEVKQVGIGYKMVKEWPKGVDKPIGNKK